MAQTVIPIITPADRERLAAIVKDRNRSQKHVQRARIILLSAERLTVLDVAACKWGEPAVGKALAASLCRARRRWIAARQDTQVGQGAVVAGDHRLRAGVALRGATESDDHWPHDGQRRRHHLERRAAHLAGWQAHHLQPHPQPFVWTKPADNNLAKLRRLPVTAD